MGIKKQTFHLVGPSFLNNVDWNNLDHRRSIAASLVKGVEINERDRQKNRQGPTALAHSWWEFFGFKLKTILVDDHDRSIFGAIYEFTNFKPENPNTSPKGPPQFVVALRGTMNKRRNMVQDYILDVKCLVNNLNKCSRFRIGFESVNELVHRVDSRHVWLVGYSQGAAISLNIGRRMIKDTRIHLETYLFNPPFISPPIGRIKSEDVRRHLRVFKSLFVTGIVHVTGQKVLFDENEPFKVLSKWAPYLFVNSSDPICSEYVGYFEHRDAMESIGLGEIEMISTKYSYIGSMVLAIAHKDFERAAHLIPSAHVTINTSPCGVLEAHMLKQWWRNDLRFDSKSYEFNPSSLSSTD